MSLPVIILAGGLGTRLGPLTKACPKALINVAGKPFISYQLHYLQTQGIKQIVLCIGHLGTLIQKYIGNGSRFGVNVTYSYDGMTPLGTGGAVKQALHLVSEPFFLLYGDSFLPIDFTGIEKAFLLQNKPALMTIFKNNNCWDRSNVLYKEDRLIEYNKKAPNLAMQHIDYGLSILTKGLFSSFPLHKPFDIAELYYELSLKAQITGLEINERFYEIGSVKGLKEMEQYLQGK